MLAIHGTKEEVKMTWTKKKIEEMLNDNRPTKHRRNEYDVQLAERKGLDLPEFYTRGEYASMRAVVQIYLQQEADEQRNNSTRHDNRRGFSQAHADSGARLAKFMMTDDEGNLTDKVQRPVDGMIAVGGRRVAGKSGAWRKGKGTKWAFKVDRCREIALTYLGQLADIANGIQPGR